MVITKIAIQTFQGKRLSVGFIVQIVEENVRDDISAADSVIPGAR